MAILLLTEEGNKFKEQFLKKHSGHRIRYIYKDDGNVSLKCYKCHSVQNLSKYDRNK